MTLELSHALTTDTAAAAIRHAQGGRGLDHVAAQLTTDQDPDGLEVRRFLVQAGYPNRSKLRAALAAIESGDYVAQAELTAEDRATVADAEPTPPIVVGQGHEDRGGTRSLGPEVIATAEGPGEPGSVLNWAGVNYGPQPDPATASTEHWSTATEEQWTQWWLDRMAMYVDRGKASNWAKLPKYAKQLEEAAAMLLQGLDEEAKRAEVDAQVAELEAQLAQLRGTQTKTVGGRKAGPDPKAVRTWAKVAGIECSPAGRVPQRVVDQYLKANA